MLDKVENLIIQKSNSIFLIALFAVIYFTSQIIIGSILHQLGTLNAFALQTTMCSEKFKAIAAGWIASGEIAAYYRHFYFDYFHPVWYSIFLSLLIARAFKINNVNPKFNGFILTPFVAAICDFFENTMHLYFLADLNRATPLLVVLSGLATNTKWALAALGIMVVTVLFVLWTFKKYILKKN
ncbi:MAG: hypothetical protein QUS13_14380 [Smithella sp.]|nr:hypothetical protein [Smithella sp.]